MSRIFEHLTNSNTRENIRLTTGLRKAARDYLENLHFTEFSTPVLMPQSGEWYNTNFSITLNGKPAMLADSPQVYKMMLAHAGYDKYYQMAHCFRQISNEEEQHTRLCEFTQIDVELRDTSFADLLLLGKNLLKCLCTITGKSITFSQMDGLECRTLYGEKMKPDLHKKDDEISVVLITHMPLTNDGTTPCHHIFALPEESFFLDSTRPLCDVTTHSFDFVINGIEVGGGDLRIMKESQQRHMMELFHVNPECYTDYLEMLHEESTCQGGGFAIGLERLVMALTGSLHIHQTVPFPDYFSTFEQ